MNYDYVIRLRRPAFRSIDLISQILLLLYIAFALWKAVINGHSQLVYYIFPGMVFLSWMVNLSRAKNNPVYYRLPLLIAALGWSVVVGGWSWMTLIYGLLALLEPQVKFPDEIGFTKEKIVRNTFPRKTWEWIDVDNVMIRENLFTLDLRNNKLIQKYLETPVSVTLQEEFNAYCQRQLHFRPDTSNE